MKALEEKKQKRVISLILMVLIVFASIRLIYMYSLRNGHHVDETWSYGYANSYYDPFIYSSSRYGDVTDVEHWKNLKSWLSGQDFKNYVTVNEGEEFTFDSVLYNKEYDLGPALYTLILHFVCSLFPGVFSWNFAFSINLFFFVFSLILIYFISLEISNNRFVGLFSVLYFTLSGCGTANFLYLRIYSMFTFWALALFYVMARFLKDNYKHKSCAYVLLPVITLLGCMTHYYFLIFAFFITFFSVLVLLLKKRYSDFFKLGFIMLFSVIAFFVVYSPALNMLLPYFKKETSVAGTTGYTLSYSWNASAANMHFFMGTIGAFVNFSYALLLYVLGVLAFIFITIALIAFLFRNETWFKKFILLVKKYMKVIFTCVIEFFKTFDITLFVAVFATIAFFLTIPISVALYSMGFVERYLFPAMALFVTAYASVMASIIFLLVRSKNNRIIKRIVAGILCVVLLYMVCRSNILTNQFKFTGMNEKELTSDLNGKDCYVLAHAVRDMVWLSPVLSDCNSIYIDLCGSVAEEDYALPDFNDECLLLINTTDFLTEDQKLTYEESGDFELVGMRRPMIYMTVDDYISDIEKETGLKYSLIEESNSFIGVLRLYQAK